MHTLFDLQKTPVKSSDGSSQVLSSPPIKLKITLGGNNKKSTSSVGAHLSSVKCNVGTRNVSSPIQSTSILKSKSCRKPTKITSRSGDKIIACSSDRKRKDRYIPTTSSYVPLQSAESSGNVENVSENPDNERCDSSDSECDEEEKWLNAVESGNYGSLDKIDSELKNIKDPKLMTARQRAMVAAVGGR